MAGVSTCLAKLRAPPLCPCVYRVSATTAKTTDSSGKKILNRLKASCCGRCARCASRSWQPSRRTLCAWVPRQPSGCMPQNSEQYCAPQPGCVYLSAPCCVSTCLIVFAFVNAGVVVACGRFSPVVDSGREQVCVGPRTGAILCVHCVPLLQWRSNSTAN